MVEHLTFLLLCRVQSKVNAREAIVLCPEGAKIQIKIDSELKKTNLIGCTAVHQIPEIHDASALQYFHFLSVGHKRRKLFITKATKIMI